MYMYNNAEKLCPNWDLKPGPPAFHEFNIVKYMHLN